MTMHLDAGHLLRIGTRQAGADPSVAAGCVVQACRPRRPVPHQSGNLHPVQNTLGISRELVPRTVQADEFAPPRPELPIDHSQQVGSRPVQAGEFPRTRGDGLQKQCYGPPAPVA